MQNMIDSTIQTIADLESAQREVKNVLLGHGYIVECQGVHLTFDVINGVALNPRNSQPHMARRFTLRDAAAVGAGVTNGNGIKGVAVHVRDAVNARLAEAREVLAMMQAHQAKATA